MRIGTLFSGIGAPEQGAKRVFGDDLELVFACEYDKFARQSFNANYEINSEHFHKDVREMDGTQYQGKVDVLVGGSPCQAFSIAGLRNGTDDERGQLIYQYIRIVNEVKAPIIIYENVKGMMSIEGGKTIREFVQALRDIGYFCHYEVVNTKDYGVPQNRERIFLVGFIDHEMYHRFQFAPKQKLEKRLKDVLESEVDKKYYLSNKMVDYLAQKPRSVEPYNGKQEISPCCLASYHKTPTDGFYINEGVIGMLDIKGNDQIKRVYGTDGIAPCLQTMQGGNREPKIIDDQGRIKKQENPILLDYCPTLRAQSHGNEPKVVEPKICAMRGRNPQNLTSRQSGLKTVQMIEKNDNGTSNCLTSVQKDNLVLENQYLIRKLTPRECLRLQDFPDTFLQVCSDSQQYKQAGNSMSCNVLEMIFRQIEKAKEIEEGRLF